ncbi:MAG: C39 family peptidase, partial [Candidatus Eremiobacteraeota bacterium]|nr:C39 family peptidase [Candidatus Eremiobacteraeota bacterium]
MLRLVHPEPGEEIAVNVGPTREAIVSWNALALDGAIELRANSIDGRTSAWLPYVAFSSEKRASLASADGFVRIDTDVLRGDVDLVTVGIRSRGALEAVFVRTPDYGAPSGIVALPAVELDVPRCSQYESAYPSERGWCAPASLAMLLAYRDYPIDVPIVAREVFDSRYGGTGNWAFNAAFAGTLGFPSAVLHVRDLGAAHAFLADDIPLALSIAWENGALPGAPLPRSD